MRQKRMQRPSSPTGLNLLGTRDLKELSRLMHQTVVRQMDATIFFLGLYDEASKTVEVVWQVENGKELSGGSFPLGKGLTSQVILNGEARLINRWSEEGARVEAPGATSAPGLPESAAGVPLRLGEQVIGLICAQSYARDAYTPRDLELLSSLAAEAAIVIAGLHYSERIGAQVRRRVSEMEAILANMADALVIVDARGCLVRLNSAARDLLSLDEASVVLGQPLGEKWDHWPLGGRAVAEALRPVVEQLQRSGQTHEVEVVLAEPAQRTLSFRATPLHDADGELSGGLIVFRDLTGPRQEARVKDEMFSMASHDLKIPATVIKAQAQYLRRRFRTQDRQDADVAEGLTMIVNQADRLAGLINLMLERSRLEAGKLELDLAPTDLRGILVSMARALQTTTQTHVIEVNAPSGVIGQWDARRIEEVVENLLSNAVKYSPAGGVIQVRLVADEASATVTVRDNGIGIAADQMPHLFERFYRGPDIRQLEGTGLGLHICEAIVLAHGGRIWAESAGPGLGSTFAFTLPLSRYAH
jgi:signal transduction histidine kinase